MRLAKFSLCNRLSVKALATLFAVEGENARNVDLRCSDRWNLQALATALEIADDEVHAGFCVGPSRLGPGEASAQLRCCSACMERGFHVAWFQWRLVERCPLHRLPLRTGCVRCTAPIPYALGHDLASNPLSCASCGRAWVPALSRPAGRCTPLDRRDSRLMQRWSVYVENAVGDERHQPRGPLGTWVVPRPPARPHPVTMVNRLFDAPPPQLDDVLLRRHRAPPPPVPGPKAETDLTDSGYEATGWPHFDHSFAQWEDALRKAQAQLFSNVLDVCGRGRLRHLLTSDLMAPGDAMDRRTAAAVGWSVTWMSSVEVLAPKEGLPIPALGLAGWLANLPVRPQRTSRRRWKAQTLTWLEGDFALSARIWSRIAAFMHAKGTYVFHGAIVDLPALAQRHRDEVMPVATLRQSVSSACN